MKILDFFSIDNGLFTTVKKVAADTYNELFGTTEPAVYDSMLLATCGERTPSPLVTSMLNSGGELPDNARETLALVLLVKYGESWKRVHNALIADYEAENPYSVTTEKTTTTESNHETTNKNVSKIYGFDSDDSTGGANDTENESTDTGKSGATVTDNTTVKGNTGNRTRAEIIQTELNLRQNNFVTIVMNDIKNTISNAVYE